MQTTTRAPIMTASRDTIAMVCSYLDNNSIMAFRGTCTQAQGDASEKYVKKLPLDSRTHIFVGGKLAHFRQMANPLSIEDFYQNRVIRVISSRDPATLVALRVLGIQPTNDTLGSAGPAQSAAVTQSRTDWRQEAISALRIQHPQDKKDDGGSRKFGDDSDNDDLYDC